MSQLLDFQSELVRRHRSASWVAFGVLALVLILLGITYWFGERISQPGEPRVDKPLWIAILVLSLGALLLRRTRFAAGRLKDIAAAQGPSALLKTLQITAIQLALVGAAIAVTGFVIMIRTGDWFYMLRASGVAAIVLAYGYPIKKSWQRAVTILGSGAD